jgi:hypothetical protein
MCRLDYGSKVVMFVGREAAEATGEEMVLSVGWAS